MANTPTPLETITAAFQLLNQLCGAQSQAVTLQPALSVSSSAVTMLVIAVSPQREDKPHMGQHLG